MLSNVLAASERPMTGARFRRSTERRRASCATSPAVPKTETAACATRYEVQAVPKRINSVNHAAGESKGKEKGERDVRNAYVSTPLSAREESSFCDVAFPSTDGGLFRYVSTTSMGRHKGVSGSPALPLEWVDL